MTAGLVDVTAGVQVLAQEGVVGMPTETVYGLAARIDQPQALTKIFTTKERPFFDPLIVHVASPNEARALTSEWPLAAEVLAQTFWPGPLTMVLPKSAKVSDLITSGLQSVGLRMPAHPLALELIRQAGSPLAAPSANRFGRTSPTTAQHVLQEFGSQVPVIDGGPCQIGIESTVLRMQSDTSGKTQLQILRPGAITLPEITKVLVENKVDFSVSESLERAVAPGQMKHHYMPDIPLVWVDSRKQMSLAEVTASLQAALASLPETVEGVRLKKPTAPLQRPAALKLESDPALAARHLYSRLRELSQSGADHLVYVHDSTHTGEAWEGLLDRLKKASHLVFE